MRILTYLFTCRVVSHGPGRASQETSWSGTSSAPSSLLRLLLCRRAHLVALSCLYFRWKFSLLAVSLISLGMSLQLFTTLLLKKFLLISRRPCLTFRLREFAVLRVVLTLSAALSNHWFESRLPRPHRILWTMAMSAWCLRSSSVGRPSSLNLSL